MVEKATKLSEDFIYEKYYNEEFDFSLLYPNFLNYKELSATGGCIDYHTKNRSVSLVIGRSINDTNVTVDSDYNNAIKTGGNIIYKTQLENWFVISSIFKDKFIHTKEIVGKGSIVAFTFTCPFKEKEKYTKVISKLEESLIAPSIDIVH